MTSTPALSIGERSNLAPRVHSVEGWIMAQTELDVAACLLAFGRTKF
jgi:hypothetical protein